MQAKDLRIDNWFYAVHPVDGLFEMQVRGIAQDGTIETDAYGNTYGTIDCYGDSCKPIPLTEEWLIKFSWKKIDDNVMVVEYKKGAYFLTQSKRFGSWTLFKMYFTGEDHNLRQYCPVKVLSKVHELQNTWHVLENEELEIK